eukprot:SAG11_NODE_5293_length_1604_cov_1.388704_2_plen_88_part_00
MPGGQIIDIEVKNRELDKGGKTREVGSVMGRGHDPNGKIARHLRLKGDLGKLIGVEGCAMKGYVEVKRVPGNFHVQVCHSLLNTLVT